MKPDKLTLSCEFFPPRTEKGRDNLRQAYEQLKTLNPAFFSVTFGAGGSTQENTLDTVVEIQQRGEYDAAPHLSCITSDKAMLRNLLQQYQQHGIQRIVALRGDRPSGFGSGAAGDLEYASELVQFIREETGDHFHIEVAAYPEFHPQATSAQADLEFFRQKVAAGADSAITQYFYNPDAYARFLDNCAKMGIDIPIVPGIMPISNYQQLARFSDGCGAEIPRWLRWRLQDFGDDLASLQAYGVEVVARLCQDLLDLGAPGLHFYTLNKADSVLNIAKQLNLR
ncbi:methylenetetrahydrofolate reductase [NAD(P)H] [Candidatus Venteria ishoeyi]|uniref:methylenetetrahydrofolate reductase [NAD(P)H] n=1 Tax=Candidatus Venteria ishoeyi TaxID=1899563 RepID=UPI0025A4FEFB|nr:methylenetetrahydrofolate reductase [NAD(P)H] [Candidatus Venteria ishoeyi]MDM8546823.1 methylenetetrahydrofolate reductase [NAD(P)H] [Candidatus Venteria ishoeyi]